MNATSQTLLACFTLALLFACQSSPAVSHISEQSGAQGAVDGNAIRTALQANGANGSSEWNSIVQADKPILLVFWQSWCASCVAEAPLVQNLLEKHGDKIAIAGVVSGPDDAVDQPALTKVIDRLGLEYTQVRDKDLGLTRLFEVTGTPDVILLDRNRKIVYRDHHLPESIEPYL